MKRVVKFCQYAKLIGFLGLPGLIWNIPVLNFLWLFWLFGLLEIVLDFSIFKQSLEMTAGMIYVPLKYGKSMPDKDNVTADIEISLPFSGSWVAVNGGVDKKLSHSWSVPTQRYAYDFIILDKDAKSFCGDLKDVGSYYCYEKEILAPADGVITELLNDQPDSMIQGKGRIDCSARDIRGNYILIQHAEHLYSTLAHLKKGSICVKEGERVVRGQKIAMCGNSGNSSEPHLHFQMQNGKSFSFSAGVPIRFQDISAKAFPGYADYDPRGTDYASGENGYIVRGQVVHNRMERQQKSAKF